MSDGGGTIVLGHCWHWLPEATLVHYDPPRVRRVCCRCGAIQHGSRATLREEGHGPFAPPGEHGGVRWPACGPCDPKEGG